jgi:hypothetical protein
VSGLCQFPDNEPRLQEDRPGSAAVDVSTRTAY